MAAIDSNCSTSRENSTIFVITPILSDAKYLNSAEANVTDLVISDDDSDISGGSEGYYYAAETIKSEELIAALTVAQPFGDGEGLGATLNPQQEALLGCGPFWGTQCDVEGIDLLIEAIA